ncbi:ATP-grasp fold amidoligase family protein [uncultured Cyclobacterium sp.]|uniref:ATP-grasp fold amidoligase family protein n=1 Tax=uncultured Cyclobacterium sp. TaxID=453820 RepID=UPI0030ED845B
MSISTSIRYTHEWLYGLIPKNIIIEPLIKDETGKIPQDYKFFCFGGKVKMFNVDFGRFNYMKRSLFDRNGNFIEGKIKCPKGEKSHGIRNLNEIIAFVESLCFGLDFVRVDIYIVKNLPIFGELTHYPGGGWSKITPFELDTKLGEFWDLKMEKRNLFNRLIV